MRCLVRRRTVANVDEFVRGDLADGSTLDAAVQGAEVVLHLAAVTHARRARDYVETNVIGTSGCSTPRRGTACAASCT